MNHFFAAIISRREFETSRDLLSTSIMKEDVVITTKVPARSGEAPRTFEIRPQQSYLWIVMFQKKLLKGAVKTERLVVVYPPDNRDGQRWQQWAHM